ncbi:MAG: TonB-dependent receptor [Bryobacterales bacterium]|nr:TonB-dependent receptor [Bryobacterales bacterium]
MRLGIQAIAVILFACASMEAQDFRGRIQGRVTDSADALVVGAEITLLNVNTGVSVTRQSNESGLYLFDYVIPGTYSLTVSLTGFRRFVQENIEVQTRADITINASLSPGAVQESVTVTAAPVAVQFNTTNVGITIDTKLANELPRFDRNPFKLSLLSPQAVNTRTEMNAFHSWAANSVELGGGTNLKNDLQVDGSPIGVGHKASYTPPPDAVQEVVILQNSVDAESGHSAGGVISMTMKSGTNDIHGNVFYLGRNPALNAVTDRTNLSNIAARNNMYGANAGHPIIKNKLFNFVVYEGWRLRDPLNYLRTLPTALERQGDFSRSLNIDGGLRAIHDPWTTQVTGSTARRTPFPDNRIPASRFDPVSARLLPQFWEPNNAGENITGINNFRTALTRRTDYWNFSDRADYVMNDKWRFSGRFSQIRTMVDSSDPSPNQSKMYVTMGASARHARQISGDAVWTASPSTVVNIRGGYHSLVDSYDSPRDKLGPEGWGIFWPGNEWYKAYDQPDAPKYVPRFTVGGSQYGIAGVYWLQEPNGNSINVKVSQQRGTHYWKAGFDHRRSGGISLVTGTTNFAFQPAMTADTFLAPNTRLVGHEWATFLLGALDTGSQAISKPMKKPRTESYAMFLQDDWKIHPNFTLNLGVRYEYETPWWDPEYRMSRFLDLNAPNEAIRRAPPQMPAQLRQFYTGPQTYNGAWVFTDENNKSSWKAPLNNWMPRLGMAWRLNDRTAVRFGYARFTAPTEFNFIDAPFAGFENINFLEPPYLGFDASQSPLPLLLGVPQARLNDPFPLSSNPLIAPRGKGWGSSFGVGEGNLLWFYQQAQRSVNDRLSLSIQRQLPGQFIADLTLFANYGHGLGNTRNLNMVDPRIGFANGVAINQVVANPFFNYLTARDFPGPLRNQAQVQLNTLFRPYPHYGNLFEINTPGRRARYQSGQIQIQRPFRNGYNMLFGYAYIRDRADTYFDEVANYVDDLGFQEATSPRHRISAAGTWELPVGRGRRVGSAMPRWMDAMAGGWQLVGAFYFNSGNYLRFGTLAVSGDPRIDNPTPTKWFNTSVFARQPAFTQRTNPWQYSGLTGPVFWDTQGSLAKVFSVTERWKTELKLAGYNLTNRLNRNSPVVDVLNSQFGQSLRQAGTTGRQMEIGLKIMF